MGPDFPGSFERGIISSGYWGETISPGFDGQDLPWSLWGGGFPGYFGGAGSPPVIEVSSHWGGQDLPGH